MTPILNDAFLIVMLVEQGRLWLRPSIESKKLLVRLSTVKRISTLSVTTTGRVLRLCDATGLKHKVPDVGAKIGPPTESEYPVEPVGVETISPSAAKLLSWMPSISALI